MMSESIVERDADDRTLKRGLAREPIKRLGDGEEIVSFGEQIKKPREGSAFVVKDMVHAQHVDARELQRLLDDRC